MLVFGASRIILITVWTNLPSLNPDHNDYCSFIVFNVFSLIYTSEPIYIYLSYYNHNYCFLVFSFWFTYFISYTILYNLRFHHITELFTISPQTFDSFYFYLTLSFLYLLFFLCHQWYSCNVFFHFPRIDFITFGFTFLITVYVFTYM